MCSISDQRKITVKMTPMYPRCRGVCCYDRPGKEKHWDEAKTELKKLGLNVTEAGTEISDSYEKGEIIDQDVRRARQ